MELENHNRITPLHFYTIIHLILQTIYIISGTAIDLYLLGNVLTRELIIPVLIMTNSVLKILSFIKTLPTNTLPTTRNSRCRGKLVSISYIIHLIVLVCFIYLSETACDPHKLIYYYCLSYLLMESACILFTIFLAICVIRYGLQLENEMSHDSPIPPVPFLLPTVQDIPIRLGASDEQLIRLKEYIYDVSVTEEPKGLNVNDHADEITVNDDQCPICQTVYSHGDLIRQLECGHSYHKDCCDAWLKLKKICPLCRTEMTMA